MPLPKNTVAVVELFRLSNFTKLVSDFFQATLNVEVLKLNLNVRKNES